MFGEASRSAGCAKARGAPSSHRRLPAANPGDPRSSPRGPLFSPPHRAPPPASSQPQTPSLSPPCPGCAFGAGARLRGPRGDPPARSTRGCGTRGDQSPKIPPRPRTRSSHGREAAVLAGLVLGVARAVSGSGRTGRTGGARGARGSRGTAGCGEGLVYAAGPPTAWMEVLS